MDGQPPVRTCHIVRFSVGDGDLTASSFRTPTIALCAMGWAKQKQTDINKHRDGTHREKSVVVLRPSGRFSSFARMSADNSSRLLLSSLRWLSF